MANEYLLSSELNYENWNLAAAFLVSLIELITGLQGWRRRENLYEQRIEM